MADNYLERQREQYEARKAAWEKAKKLGKKKIVVVHGIGEGILKEELRLLFKNDKRVKTMYTPASNIGCTIIELF